MPLLSPASRQLVLRDVLASSLPFEVIEESGTMLFKQHQTRLLVTVLPMSLRSVVQLQQIRRAAVLHH